ncbi:hypothetical protein WICPIJ_008005 [Wickerhamomyces pijperi]|uniref:Knr4/Smi1-like domain-containing protein n=1 Tax=Wickerhamomyces pijperi TaxID=599730 RepID=A0A9P8Q0J6_WICPI|nr:hypothetical protein WICPIJ_008005 [Wickerhamomyces pijperi]
MSLSIKDCIQVIKSKTSENFPHLPETYIQPGVTDQQLDDFETKYKISLPDEIKEYLKLSNGEGSNPDDQTQVGVFLGLSMLTLEDIEREMGIWKEVIQDNPEFETENYEVFPEGAVQNAYVDPDNWVGLAVDGCGNSIGIDLKPGPNGTLGQVIVFGRDIFDERIVIFKTWREFLNRVVEDLAKPGFYTIDEEYKVYDLAETNYLEYIFEEKLKEYKGDEGDEESEE